MTVLYAILVLSTLYIAYLIWDGGGFAKLPEPVAVETNVSGFTMRAGRPGDIAAFQRLAAEPESMKWQGWDADELEKREAGLHLLPADVFERLFLVAEAESGDVAGYAEIGGGDARAPDELSIGLFVSSEYSGRGLGTALMRVVIVGLQHQEVGAWVGTAATNRGMQRVMENLGFSPEPEIEPYHAPNGETFDSLWYKVGAGARPPR